MPQRFLSIKNFEKYQHFKKSNPPWIKLYRSLFTDREFMQLSIAAKYLYIGIVMLASEGSNRVPHDIQWISQRLSINPSEIDLKPLYKAGFFIASDSTIYRESISQRRDREETETETETEGEESEENQSGRIVAMPRPPRHEPDEVFLSRLEDSEAYKHVQVRIEWEKCLQWCLKNNQQRTHRRFVNWLNRIDRPAMGGGKQPLPDHIQQFLGRST